jgi:hypothetical protein
MQAQCKICKGHQGSVAKLLPHSQNVLAPLTIIGSFGPNPPWGLVRNDPKRPQPCQRAPFLLTPPSNFAISQSPIIDAPRGHQGDFGPKYEMRRRGFACWNFEGLMWKYAIRGDVTATSRTLNRKNMYNDHEIPHGIFKPTGKCRSRREIYFRGALHDGRLLQKMLVLFEKTH